jgi:dihydroneopterin triphosphate diphosphatase
MPAPACDTVAVCIFKISGGQPRYLLLRRARREKLYPGIWQFVTGSVHEGESAPDAAYRELREETGLQPARFWVVPYVDCFYDVSRDSVNLSPLFAAEVKGAAHPVLSREHSEFHWFTLGAATRKLVWPGQRAGLRIVHEFIAGGEEAAQLTRIR